MIERFRASGLSHLTAVSGQNVALLLAAAGPLLRRLRPVSALVLTIGLIAWFVVLTRAEPSILRAGVMAGARRRSPTPSGDQREPPRLARARRDRPAADRPAAGRVGRASGCRSAPPRGVTMHRPTVGEATGAGSGRWPCRSPSRSAPSSAWRCPSLLVFGRLSLVGTVANLVAVPVAGLVMLYGLPACLLGGAVPVLAPVVVAPVGWGTRWVDAVATGGSPPRTAGAWSAVGWVVLVLTVTAAPCRATVTTRCDDAHRWQCTS